MDPISAIKHLDLQTVINSVYSIEQQQVRARILLETATHEEIITNYKIHDPINEIYGQELNREEGGLLVQHYGAIAFANYIGGLKLLYDTSPTELAVRDDEHTQKFIRTIARVLLEPGPEFQVPSIDHRIIDLHSVYAGTTNNVNIHLLNSADNATRIIGAQCLRSGISDMDVLDKWHPATPGEKISFNLSLQAASGIVFGSMIKLCAEKFNDDGSINRENLSQLLETVKLYVAPSLSQTDKAYRKSQVVDFGLASIVLEKAIEQCSKSDLGNALVKGNLHEVLWILDAFALLNGNQEKYNQLGFAAADYAEDRGNIPNLTLRRGHDFRVFRRDINKGVYAQLKSYSSRRNDKPYAEEIDVYREQDFHKLIQDPDLIINKLRLYYAWSQTNFDPEVFVVSGIDSMIMPTVKEVFDKLIS
ncbi:MAG: hypothetical protein ABI220_02080 [Candidatus Saccharimonadales bacterium]